MKVTLAIASQVDGKQYQQGDVVEVDRATRNNLVYLGRARDATNEEAAPEPSADAATPHAEDEGATPAPTPRTGRGRGATNESAPEPADGKVK